MGYRNKLENTAKTSNGALNLVRLWTETGRFYPTATQALHQPLPNGLGNGLGHGIDLELAVNVLDVRADGI